MVKDDAGRGLRGWGASRETEGECGFCIEGVGEESNF